MGLFDALTAQTPQGSQLRAGLLGMGAGLLQGSTGNYGQFGPALGMGFAGAARGMDNAAQMQQRQQLIDRQTQQEQQDLQQRQQAQQWWAQNGGNLTPQAMQSGIGTGNPYLMEMIKQASSIVPKPTARRTQFDNGTGMLIDLDAGTATPVSGYTPEDETIWDTRRGGFVNKRTGELTSAIDAATGMPVAKQNDLEKPMTEAQSKDLLFGSRARESNDIIGKLTPQVNLWGAQAAGTQVYDWIPGGSFIESGLNAVAPAEIQQYNQAKRDFINAVLRKESGAVIAQEEFNNAEKQYFPQPGDTPQVIAQKAANRDLAVQGILRGAPSGQRDSLQPRQGNRPSLSDIFGN